MKLPEEFDDALGGIYDVKGLLLVLKDCVDSLSGSMKDDYQERLIGGLGHSLSMAGEKLSSAIDEMESASSQYILQRRR